LLLVSDLQQIHEPLATTPSVRYHLPTETEVHHSGALITGWKVQMEDLSKTIWKVDSDLRDEIHLIEKDFQERMKKAKDEARATAARRRGPMKAKLDKLGEQVKKEKAFLAPIRKLPIEVVTEIIAYDLDPSNYSYEIYRRWQIATVCKKWRAIIINTATFWKDINSDKWVSSERSLKTLKRRLELSGSVGLNVSLHYRTWEDDEENHLKHFNALAQAGLHRWHSLTVRVLGGRRSQPNPLLGIFSGKVSSLRTLKIQDERWESSQQNVFEPLYSLVATTAPCLESFDYHNYSLPTGFIESGMFRSLKSLFSTPVVVADIMRQTNAVADIDADSGIPRQEYKPFNAPHTVALRGPMAFSDLSGCNLNGVQDLTIDSYYHSRNSDGTYGGSYDDASSSIAPLRFQNLRTLRLSSSDNRILQWILNTTAPNLSRLSIKGENCEKVSDTAPMIQDIFVKEQSRVHIAPTHFNLEATISFASLIQIMDAWPQLVHLDFSFTGKFPWGGLAKSMCRKKNALCPNLQVLRVRGPSNPKEAVIKAWREAANTIFKSRKGKYPLEKISLDGQWHRDKHYVITVSDL
jgi:hypothetical protein